MSSNKYNPDSFISMPNPSRRGWKDAVNHLSKIDHEYVNNDDIPLLDKGWDSSEGVLHDK